MDFMEEGRKVKEREEEGRREGKGKGGERKLRGGSNRKENGGREIKEIKKCRNKRKRKYK